MKSIQNLFFTKSSLKKFLIGIGSVTLLVIIIYAAILTYAYFINQDMDKTSKVYVNEIMPVISSDWNVRELRKRASDDFMSTTNDEELAHYLLI
jgi:hypothetical protein